MDCNSEFRWCAPHSAARSAGGSSAYRRVQPKLSGGVRPVCSRRNGSGDAQGRVEAASPFVTAEHAVEELVIDVWVELLWDRAERKSTEVTFRIDAATNVVSF
jgi:hypothetical protein